MIGGDGINDESNKTAPAPYGLGEQARLGEQDVQTVTQEVRQTGDVKRLCMTVKTGERIDAMSCELIDPLSGGVK